MIEQRPHIRKQPTSAQHLSDGADVQHDVLGGVDEEAGQHRIPGPAVLGAAVDLNELTSGHGQVGVRRHTVGRENIRNSDGSQLVQPASASVPTRDIRVDLMLQSSFTSIENDVRPQKHVDRKLVALGRVTTRRHFERQSAEATARTEHPGLPDLGPRDMALQDLQQRGVAPIPLRLALHGPIPDVLPQGGCSFFQIVSLPWHFRNQPSRGGATDDGLDSIDGVPPIVLAELLQE
mmetsp:Transcript_66828/g.178255  ORF Transcript_66828/g.178255 Transcript_66828/m.178255 type:complete len:235 (-) Transcript_66828:100-804(-)